MNARVLVVLMVMFAVAAVLGAGFALLGPVRLVRVFGVIALVGGAAGCWLQLYALRAFEPRAYGLLVRRFRRGYGSVVETIPVAADRGAVLTTTRWATR